MDSYLDTSFLMKFYVTEPESLSCISWLRQNRSLVYISQLSDVEVTASLMRAFPKSVPAGMQAAQNYRSDCAAGVFRKLILDDAVYRRAERMAEQYTTTLNLKSLDLLHLATAMRFSIPSLGSFDKRLREAAQALGLGVLPA